MLSVTTYSNGCWMSELNDLPEDSVVDKSSSVRPLFWRPNGSKLDSIFRKPGLLALLILTVIAGLSLLGAVILVSISGFQTLNEQLQTVSSQTLPASAAAYEMEISLLGSGIGVMKHLLRTNPENRQDFEKDRKEFHYFLDQLKSRATDPETAAAVTQAALLFEEFETVARRLIAERDAERAVLGRVVSLTRELDAGMGNLLLVNPENGKRQIALRAGMSDLVLHLARYLELGSMESLQVLNQAAMDIRALLTFVRDQNPGTPAPREIEQAELALAEVNSLIAGHGKIDKDLVSLIDLRRRLDSVLDERIQVYTTGALKEANRVSRSQIDKNLTSMLVFTGLAGVIGISAIWVVLIGVVRPIRRLVTAADAYAHGELLHHIPPGAIGELGTLTGAMNGMAADLYEARARMEEMNASLETLVSQRTLALENANKSLAVAMNKVEKVSQAKSAFLANMSHELRTPLNAIMGFSQIMRDEMFGPLGAERYKIYSYDIYDSAVHLLTMINGILDLSQLDTGALAIRAESVDVSGVVSDCHTAIAEKAAHKGLRAKISIEDNLPNLRADAIRLQQVVEHLADNALKFTPPGGLVSIEAERTTEGGVSIAVADSGNGMRVDEISQALEDVFSRPNVELARQNGGVGLGLPLSRALAERMGAKLFIDSTPGEGTKVSVIFPNLRVIEASRVS